MHSEFVSLIVKLFSAIIYYKIDPACCNFFLSPFPRHSVIIIKIGFVLLTAPISRQVYKYIVLLSECELANICECLDCNKKKVGGEITDAAKN